MRRLLPRRQHAPSIHAAPDMLPARSSVARRLRWSNLLSSTLLLRINATAQQRSVYNDQTNVANTLTRSILNYVSDMRQQLRTYMLIVRPGITSAAQWCLRQTTSRLAGRLWRNGPPRKPLPAFPCWRC